MWRRSAAASVLVVVLNSEAVPQVAEPIGVMILEWNKRCGPLSGKLPHQLSTVIRQECESTATKINELLDLRPFGDALAPGAARRMSGRPLQALGGIESCKKGTGHDPKYISYKATRSITGGRRDELCTAPVPSNIPIRGITCEVSKGRTGGEACASNGNNGDCSLVLTITVSTRLSLAGNRYCWWVHNQSDSEREFSISVN
jgi:hypothetical protein